MHKLSFYTNHEEFIGTILTENINKTMNEIIKKGYVNLEDKIIFNDKISIIRVKTLYQ